MAKRPLHIAILWHMHQPDYSDSETGEIDLPWTRFHAVKDYYDMARLAAEDSGFPLTINVVPSLLDQIAAYSDRSAHEACANLSLKNAAQLDDREKAFILRTFFQLSWKHMVYPYPRYRELLDRRGSADASGEFPVGFKQYSTQDYRDLQTWYNLTWSGNELRQNPEIAALIRKGRAFTEQEKGRVLEIQTSFIARILPCYRELHQRGIELSLSPYYHPILPLLCNSYSAREALPSNPLPKDHFAFPADASEQIARAQLRFADLFGHEAQGMWPSEGSVSDATLALARSAGLRWLASDEAVLLQSLQKLGRASAGLSPEQRYSVYRWGDGEAGPCLFFRDHALSDLIGFTYASWRTEDASADFLRHLRLIHGSLPDDGRAYVVTIILDGENAWEHYPENGAPFLRSLYRSIKGTPELVPVTFAMFLDLEQPREPLPSLVAGSWIYGNFATWIGHPEKNRGWEFLAEARRCLGVSQGEQVPADQMKRAQKEMMIAEGSDWFWWYGDDHQTENAAEFDALFRGHVKNVYRFLAKKYPAELDTPIKRVGVRAQYQSPVHTMTPRMDGRVSDYFEWLSAGFAIPGAGASMHRSRRHLDKLFFGYDLRNLYFRLDLVSLRKEAPKGLSLKFQFASPAECSVAIAPDNGGKWKGTIAGSMTKETTVDVAVDKIVELGIPLDALGIRSSSEVRFSVSVLEGDREVERFPSNSFLSVPVDPWGLDQHEWFV